MLIKNRKGPETGRIRSWTTWPRENVIGFGAILCALVIAAIVVALFKNPNQMGVIESQSMNMNNMRPPQGAVPVALAKVETRQIGQLFTYTGTVRAYEDQDVVSRIAGQLTQVLVYPGDHVRRGQVVAQIDSRNSEYVSRAEEARLGELAASHNVGIAEEELQQRRHDAQAAQEEISQAEHSVAGAAADVGYWTAEIAREKQLLASRVVSQEEFDSELAKAKTAEATLAQAKDRVAEQRNKYQAALEAADAGRHHIIHQQAMAQQASAAAKTASIIAGYTTIRAQGDGVVTQRAVSPGVLVQPGQMLMRIAVIDRVRVQASVASSDAQQLAVGDSVQIRGSENSKESTRATVTAVFPAADPAARTSIVESVIANTGNRWLPGAFVVVEIAGKTSTGMAVPSSAIVRFNSQTHVWKASGDQQKIVQLVPVEIGSSNGYWTQVVSGLRAGDQVVAQGQANLQPGMAVVGTEWTAEGPKALPVPSETGALRLDSSNNWTVQRQLGDLKLAITMRDKPAKGANNAVLVTIQDSSGKPLPGVAIKGSSSMPSMNMDGPNLSGTTDGAGTARLDAFFMSGPWHVEAELRQGAKSHKLALDIEVL